MFATALKLFSQRITEDLVIEKYKTLFIKIKNVLNGGIDSVLYKSKSCQLCLKMTRPFQNVSGNARSHR
jgi:hypothetical protein